MTRPEDITEDAWEKALPYARKVIAGEDFSTIEALNRVLNAARCTIARAIQSAVEAEREACALIAADYFDHPSELASFIGEEIADAIRERKGA